MTTGHITAITGERGSTGGVYTSSCTIYGFIKNDTMTITRIQRCEYRGVHAGLRLYLEVTTHIEDHFRTSPSKPNGVPEGKLHRTATSRTTGGEVRSI